jgi:hypothetical protein
MVLTTEQFSEDLICCDVPSLAQEGEHQIWDIKSNSVRIYQQIQEMWVNDNNSFLREVNCLMTDTRTKISYKLDKILYKSYNSHSKTHFIQ